MNKRETAPQRWCRAVVPGAVVLTLLLGSIPAVAQAADSATTRTISGAIVGRSPLPEEDAGKVQAAIASALEDEKIAPLAQKLADARTEYLADRKKFSAERSPEIKRRYQDALDAVVAAVRADIDANHPDAAAVLAKGSKKSTADKKGATTAEYEGENALDSAARNKLAVQPIQDVPGLPRVLLIGDSISIGYTLNVRDMLKGKANVHRIPANAGATEVGLANMQKWLGDGKWDVIHFNFGLHDAKFASETTQRASREEYAENLRKLIAQMKATGAKLVFATTTPVPKDGNISPTRRFDSIPERNEIAIKVMKENGVAIDDLYAVVLPVQSQVGRDNDVHFGPAGYELLGKAVAESIEAQLAAKSGQK